MMVEGYQELNRRGNDISESDDGCVYATSLNLFIAVIKLITLILRQSILIMFCAAVLFCAQPAIVMHILAATTESHTHTHKHEHIFHIVKGSLQRYGSPELFSFPPG